MKPQRTQKKKHKNSINHRFHRFTQIKRLSFKNLCSLWFQVFVLPYSPFLLILILLLFSGNAFSAPPERIISLAPSITEILYAIGLEDKIVAVTNFCDYPSGAKKKPKVGGMSNPSLEAVVSMKPDIVVMTTDGNPKEFEERLKHLGIRTYVFRARRLIELSQGIRDMGEALSIKDNAYKLAEDIETAIDNFKSAICNPQSAIKKKALFIVWPEPLVVAGHGTTIDDALQLLGWENIASDAIGGYPKYSIEEVIHRSPDVILIGKSMGVDTKENSKGLLKKLDMLEAVKKGRVYYTGDVIYRLGPRIIEGIEELKGYLNTSHQ